MDDEDELKLYIRMTTANLNSHTPSCYHTPSVNYGRPMSLENCSLIQVSLYNLDFLGLNYHRLVFPTKKGVKCGNTIQLS